jgi:hypothetical protein
VADQLKLGIAKPLGQIFFVAGIEVIEADHIVTQGHQPIDQVRANKSRAAGD